MQKQSTAFKKNNNKALVLYSSGMDSTYNLLLAKKKFESVKVLFFDYGQKAFSQEYIRVKKLCKILGLVFIKIDLPWCRELDSSLLSIDKKVTTYSSMQKLNKVVSAIPEWVPNRNAVFVNIAGAIAESKGIGSIVIGINKEEASRYPDNSESFIDAVNVLFEHSTLTKPKLVSFSTTMNKSDIIKELLVLIKEYEIGLEYIWSCYNSYEKMCGSCESCLRFIDALSLNIKGEEWKELFLRQNI